jgi:hypothetical protein
MNALHKRSASGVQARRSSAVPCAITEAGEAINDSKATRASAFNRRRIDLSSPIRKNLQSETGPINGVPDEVLTKPLPDPWYRGATDAY